MSGVERKRERELTPRVHLALSLCENFAFVHAPILRRELIPSFFLVCLSVFCSLDFFILCLLPSFL